MSTGAPASRAMIRPDSTFTSTLVFRFQGFVDSAHISIHLPTLGDLGIILLIYLCIILPIYLGIILTISPWPPLEV